MHASKSIIHRLLVFCLLSSALCFLCPGCNSNNELTPEQLTQLADQVTSLTEQLTIYQAQVTLIADQLQQSGIIEPNDAAKVAKLNAEIDKIKAQVSAVADAIRAGTYNPNDDTLLTILKAAQAANTATAIWNPYSTYISIGLGAIIMILSLFTKKKSNQSALATTTLRAVTKAIEVAPPDAQKALKATVENNLKQAGIANEGKNLITEVKTS